MRRSLWKDLIVAFRYLKGPKGKLERDLVWWEVILPIAGVGIWWFLRSQAQEISPKSRWSHYHSASQHQPTNHCCTSYLCGMMRSQSSGRISSLIGFPWNLHYFQVKINPLTHENAVETISRIIHSWWKGVQDIFNKEGSIFLLCLLFQVPCTLSLCWECRIKSSLKVVKKKMVSLRGQQQIRIIAAFIDHMSTVVT